MNLNPKLFEGWKDPEGGEWIRIVRGKYENVVWRPVEIDFPDPDDEAKMTFRVEFFTGPGFDMPEETDTHFSEVCGSIITDIITEAVNENLGKPTAS